MAVIVTTIAQPSTLRGVTADLGGGKDTIFLGGLDPLKSVFPDPSQLQGLALGVRGPDLGVTNAFPGIPAGICTVANSESKPFSASLFIGTPSTGRMV